MSCTNGVTYTGTFTVIANTTLNAIACRRGFEPSVAWSLVYGIATSPPLLITGPDRAQLAGDATQVDVPSGTVFTENVRLLIPNERDATGTTVDTRSGTRRATDVDCFTTDGSTPACSVGALTCAKGTRYVPLPAITTASVGVTTDGNQPSVVRRVSRSENPTIKVVRCRPYSDGTVITSTIASYVYRLKVGPLSASYITRDGSFATVALASKEDDALTSAVTTGTGVRAEFVGGSAGGEDHGLDAVATGYRSTQAGAISSSVAGAGPVSADEEKICYTLDGTPPRCDHIIVFSGDYTELVHCPGSVDDQAAPLGSSTFSAANTSVPGGVPTTAGAPQRMLPFTLRAIACKPGFENGDERQIVFGN